MTTPAVALIPEARGGPLERWLEHAIFGHRTLILVLFALGTLLLGLIAWRGLRIDTSFNKTLPLQHEYMRTYLDPKVAEFRGANRVLIALIARDGNMFTPEFFEAMRKATDEVTVMDGIDRTRVQSIFTPNVRYLEVVEDGIEAGNVMPADFTPDAREHGARARQHPQGRHPRAPGSQRLLRRPGERDRARPGRPGPAR